MNTKRINVEIPIELHNQFKARAAINGEKMKSLILEWVKKYVAEG